MAKTRDEFSPATRGRIALRAGYHCSVCDKPTAGPKFGDPTGVVVDGAAAHITAAAPKGPRYDKLLSSSDRRAATNGIWVCRKHSGLIDSDEGRFLIDDLRQLKEIRERKAGRERDAQAAKPALEGDTARLIELPDIRHRYGLFDLLRTQPYTYPMTSEFRQYIQSAERPPQILVWGTEILVEVWDSDRDLAGILTTALSTNLHLWSPSDALLDKLQALCRKELDRGRWSWVAVVEPLAFALGAKGRPKPHRSLLAALVGSEHWRRADAHRIAAYYGSYGAELVGITRHFHDPARKGLLRANDVARLIHLLESDIGDLQQRPATRRRVIDLLEANIRVLQDCGEESLKKEAIVVMQDSRRRYSDAGA